MGIISVFDKEKCTFLKSPCITGIVLGYAPCCGGLYYSLNVHVKHQILEKCNKSDVDVMLWHRCFNHTNIQTLCKNLQLAVVNMAGHSESKVRECQVCLQGKMSWRRMQSREGHRIQKKFKVIHTDGSECGSTSHDGSRYFVFFVNEYSKFVRSYAINHKSAVWVWFWRYESEVERLGGVTIAELFSDNGG